MTSVRFRALTANSKQIRSDAIIAGFGQAQRKWAEGVKQKVSVEPTKITESRYVRTGDLVRGWNITGPLLSASGLVVRLNNATKYVRYVHGDEQGRGQVRVHQGRWVLLSDAIDREGYAQLMRDVVKRNVG